jgi:hypothetical protein
MLRVVPTIEQCDENLLVLAAETKRVVEVAAYAFQDYSEDSSDSDDDHEPAESQTSLDDAFKDIETEVQCLQALGPRFEEPVLDRQTHKGKGNFNMEYEKTNWDPVEYLSTRIRQRYPDADPDTITTLGKTNWNRLLRLHAVKENNLAGPEREARHQSMKRPAASERDSGLGSSIARTASYAETLVSYHGAKGGSIRIPPLPAESSTGSPVTCVACNRNIVVRTPSQWK